MTNTPMNVGAKHFGAEDVVRLKQLVKEGVKIHQEIDDLKSGLSDTVKSMAEELEIRPAQLNKVIRVVHKNSLQDEREALDEVDELIQIINSRTPIKK